MKSNFKKSDRYLHAILFLMNFMFILVIFRTAWITDDAAITLRTVLNFTNGFGPTFNIDERVQAYTHPLWFLLLPATSIAFKNIFYGTFGLSIFLSAICYFMITNSVRNRPITMTVAGLAMISSKAFVDFSTSGLENPLTHTLLAAAIMLIHAPGMESNRKQSSNQAIKQSSNQAIKQSSNQAIFFMICACLYLNRPDTILLVFPTISFMILGKNTSPKEKLRMLIIFAVPISAWMAFSLGGINNQVQHPASEVPRWESTTNSSALKNGQRS